MLWRLLFGGGEFVRKIFIFFLEILETETALSLESDKFRVQVKAERLQLLY